MKADYIARIRDLLKDSAVVAPTVQMAVSEDLELPALDSEVGRTFYCQATAVTKYGETLPCAIVTIEVPEASGVVITLGRVPEATAYRIYAAWGASNTPVLLRQTELAHAATGNPTFSPTAMVSGAGIPTADTASRELSMNSYSAIVDAAIHLYNQNHTECTVDTIPAKHFEGVCHLAASMGCQELSAAYAYTANKTISADSVNYTMKSSAFQKLSDSYLESANRLLGVTKGNSPYSTSVHWRHHQC